MLALSNAALFYGVIAAWVVFVAGVLVGVLIGKAPMEPDDVAAPTCPTHIDFEEFFNDPHLRP